MALMCGSLWVGGIGLLRQHLSWRGWSIYFPKLLYKIQRSYPMLFRRSRRRETKRCGTMSFPYPCLWLERMRHDGRYFVAEGMFFCRALERGRSFVLFCSLDGIFVVCSNGECIVQQTCN
ncbi:unnamed protein product [Cuscuta campestris]|uniref:Uncharacterized protein n=1 Tax=Cuscuta campestris TaxID=132261 RepID=A0A484LMZ7_9ASTE|nr:unnamed protein product [Cuscuta campestris]